MSRDYEFGSPEELDEKQIKLLLKKILEELGLTLMIFKDGSVGLYRWPEDD